jgi:hypothetical protein
VNSPKKYLLNADQVPIFAVFDEMGKHLLRSENIISLLKNSTDEFTYKEMSLHSLVLSPKQQSAHTDVLRG